MAALTLQLQEALGDYQAIYLSSRNLAERTRREYVTDIVDLVRFLGVGGVGSPQDVTINHLQEYLAELDKRGLKGSTRRRKVFAIRSLFGFLHSSGRLDANPTEKLIPPEVEQSQPRVLSEREYKQLQLSVAQSTDFAAVRDAAIIEVLLQTGMRLTELATLLLGAVVLPEKIRPDGEPGSVQILGKGRKERICTLNWKGCRAVRAYLQQRPASADQRLFLSKYRRGLTPRAIQKLVEKRLRDAGIKGASVHSLRHTFGTQHALNGTDLPVIRDMMGHSTIGTTEKYVHLAREVQKKQIQKNAL